MFTKDPVAQRLSELTVMGGVRGRERRKRARHFDPVTVEPGTVLIEQGRRNRHTYFVVSGALAVEIDGEQIAVLGADEVAGERTALHRNLLANATVRAIEPTEVLVADHRAVVALVSDEPSVGDALHEVLESRAA